MPCKSCQLILRGSENKKRAMTPSRAIITEKTFDTFKEIYSKFRNEDDNKVSEDVIGIIVPGSPWNTPRNRVAEVAWTVLNKLQPKHSQPKVG